MAEAKKTNYANIENINTLLGAEGIGALVKEVQGTEKRVGDILKKLSELENLAKAKAQEEAAKAEEARVAAEKAAAEQREAEAAAQRAAEAAKALLLRNPNDRPRNSDSAAPPSPLPAKTPAAIEHNTSHASGGPLTLAAKVPKNQRTPSAPSSGRTPDEGSTAATIHE